MQKGVIYDKAKRRLRQDAHKTAGKSLRQPTQPQQHGAQGRVGQSLCSKAKRQITTRLGVNMSERIFDFFGSEYLRKTSDNTAVDDDGNTYIKLGDNMAMDTDSGELHITSGWDDTQED